jgi:hypothetical protein
LGFVEVNYVAAFEEFELQFQVGGMSGGSSNSGSKIAEENGTVHAGLDEAQIERNRRLVLERGSHAVYENFAEVANYAD